jgi:hypothetical protein
VSRGALALCGPCRAAQGQEQEDHETHAQVEAGAGEAVEVSRSRWYVCRGHDDARARWRDRRDAVRTGLARTRIRGPRRRRIAVRHQERLLTETPSMGRRVTYTMTITWGDVQMVFGDSTPTPTPTVTRGVWHADSPLAKRKRSCD